MRKNCESQSMEYINDNEPTIPYGFKFKYSEGDLIRLIGRNGDSAPDRKVTSYFLQHKNPLVFVDALSSLFIDEDGVLMLTVQDDNDNQCALQHNDSTNEWNIRYEMCGNN